MVGIPFGATNRSSDFWHEEFVKLQYFLFFEAADLTASKNITYWQLNAKILIEGQKSCVERVRIGIFFFKGFSLLLRGIDFNIFYTFASLH